MKKTALLLSAALTLTVATAATAATEVQTCRKAVSKDVAGLYKTAMQGSLKCFKARLKSAGGQDCLDPAVFDPSDKIGGAADKLAGDMSDTPNSKCGSLGSGFFVGCTDPPPTCMAECATCATAADASACLACRVVDIALAQATELFGTGLPSLDADAQKCQNTIGKGSVKVARTRIKEQQSCAAAFSANQHRADCRTRDAKGKLKKTDAKNGGGVVKSCLTSPGSDQVPELTGAACDASDANGAAACSVGQGRSAADAIYALASSPPGIFGFVTIAGTDGTPLPLRGVRIEIAGANVGTKTDRNGFYKVVGVPPGQQTQVIDGQGVGPYPRVGMGFPAPMAGLCPMGAFPMPPIDMANAIDVGALLNGSNDLMAPVSLTNPNVPGTSLDLPAGTHLTFDVPNRAPKLSVSVVPTAAMPFPPDVFTDEIFTFQPEGTQISPPANATFPNNLGLGIGQQADIWLPDFATNTFFIAGSGTVQAPGDTIDSDGPVIDRFDWHFVADPNAPVGCTTTVVGRVIDGDTLLPIAGAQVDVFGTPTSSLADGTFSLLYPVCTTSLIVQVAGVQPSTGVYIAGYVTKPTVFNGTTDFGDVPLAAPACGNGLVEGGEDCDDGGNDAGDGCSSTCIIEECGNAVIDAGEECDGSIGCSDFCILCGNGLLLIPGEECDLGAQNGMPASGCSSNCKITVCGNGIIEEDEGCDDGNANGGSQSLCSETCVILGGAKTVVSGDLVRAFESCPGPTYPSPNSQTGSGVPACAPVVLESSVEFGASGQGAAAAGLSTDGGDVVLTALVTGVGSPPITGAAGWRVRWTLRISLRDATNFADPDVTLQDVVVDAAAVLDGTGNLRAGTLLSTASPVALSVYGEHAVEVREVEVVDPSGDVFGVVGYLTTGPTPLTADAPLVARAVSGPLARSYAQCGGSITYPSPNATAFGLPACEPPYQHSAYLLAPSGGATFKSLASGDDVRFEVALAGVLEPDGITPSNDPNWTLRLWLRVTEVDPDNGEMTVIDFPIEVPFVKFAKGKGLVKSGLNEILGNLGLPPFGAAQIEMLPGSPAVIDPAGNPFLSIGLR